MSLLEQPDEIIRIQLAQLPIEDLLTACQSNFQLAEICRDPSLWRMKLQADFPGINPRIPDPKILYLRLLEERARQELFKRLKHVSFYIGLSPEELDSGLEESLDPEDYHALLQPISGLHKLAIYYPLTDIGEYRMEYKSDKPMTPIQVLQSIQQFYSYPLSFVVGTKTHLLPRVTISDLLRDEILAHSIRPLEEGLTFDLGH